MSQNQLAQLYKLQSCEQQLKELNTTRKQAPETSVVAELKKRAEQFRTLHAMLQKRLDEANKKARANELDLATAEEAKTTVQNRLYGGEVTNSKELAQLEYRLQEIKENIAEQEQHVLTSLEAVEAIQAQIDKVEAGAAKNDQQLQVAQDKLTHKESEWDLEQAILQSEYDELMATIQPEMLAAYERKKKTTNDEPIARVSHGVCSGCRTELPSSVQNIVQTKKIITCERCGRFLHWPDE